MRPLFLISHLSIKNVCKSLYFGLLFVIYASITTAFASPSVYHDDDITQGTLEYFQQNPVLQAFALDTLVEHGCVGLSQSVHG